MVGPRNRGGRPVRAQRSQERQVNPRRVSLVRPGGPAVHSSGGPWDHWITPTKGAQHGPPRS